TMKVEEITEIKAEKAVTHFRSQRPGFEQPSFATIAAYGAHGAIVHYEAEPHTDIPLRPESLFLLDSGGQYAGGTTDITRTLALGTLTEEERRAYTLVLKGHIALSNCRFPEGSTGLQLDLAARYAMWQQGYDFGHGTGHGVGAHLCVHEGPMQIRKNLRACTLVPLTEGMIITNEPGIYVEGKFGVRIENTLLVRRSLNTPFGRFLEFEPLTLCPIDLRPVHLSWLTADEREWLNTYHRQVREALMPLLTDEADRQWLTEATREVPIA
ncbi:MAG: M24 family metallopeptidase, partial [Bacteroidaceae bacterium]|nr:M24 family metallopeptidase [Bacteroidaceae bacterium]